MCVLADYQLLCGNQAPGFIIDIHTGKPIGKVIKIYVQYVTSKAKLHAGVTVLMASVQTLMSAGRSPVSVPMECVSTRSGASAVNVQWASATTTFCSFVKVKPVNLLRPNYFNEFVLTKQAGLDVKTI